MKKSWFGRFVNWYIHNYSKDTLLLKSEVDEYNFKNILEAKQFEAARVNSIRDTQEKRLKEELDRDYTAIVNESEANYQQMKADFDRLNERKDFIEKSEYQLKERIKHIVRIENEIKRRMSEFTSITNTMTCGFNQVVEDTEKLIENKS
jgi:hypothetical protein